MQDEIVRAVTSMTNWCPKGTDGGELIPANSFVIDSSCPREKRLEMIPLPHLETPPLPVSAGRDGHAMEGAFLGIETAFTFVTVHTP
jgi:hypothetical protein